MLPNITKVNKETLEKLESRVLNNMASAEDYKFIDDIIQSKIGIKDFFLNSLKEVGVLNYQGYIEERVKRMGTVNQFEGRLLGLVLGAIKLVGTKI